MSYSKDIIDSVRDIELITILKYFNAKNDVYDKKKWYTEQGTISITQQKFYNWNRAIGGGGAIDLTMHLRKCNFISALTWLRYTFDVPIPNKIKWHPDPKQHAMRLPLRNDTNLKQVIKYLGEKRCIDKKVIEMLIDQGKLYADNNANAIFILLGKNKKIVGAELCGTSKYKFKNMVKGSKKNMGCFSIKPRVKTNKIILCESAIDAASYFTMHDDTIAISTAGARPYPKWLKYLINNKFDIYCGFDADDTGDYAANKMIKLFPQIKRLRPKKHDWNDMLRKQPLY